MIRSSPIAASHFVGGDGGTNVSVVNVRWKHMEQVKVAVESGDFFCRCKELTR